jgi:S-adenosylmethionine decarboxylase proenzyme
MALAIRVVVARSVLVEGREDMALSTRDNGKGILRGRGLSIIDAMQGLHLTADLRGCDRALSAMTDAQALRELCVEAVVRCGLRPVGELFHRFAGAGVTGVVLLAESHMAVHTWPELEAVTIDVYVCNFGADNSARAEALLAAIEAAFAPSRSERHRLHRGTIE